MIEGIVTFILGITFTLIIFEAYPPYWPQVIFISQDSLAQTLSAGASFCAVAAALIIAIWRDRLKA